MNRITRSLNKLINWSKLNLQLIGKLLLLLLAVNFLNALTRHFFADDIVISIKTTKSDVLQVFFPLSSKYKEENSEQVAITENKLNIVSIPLPPFAIDHIRIDPTTKSNNVVISRIEVNHFFGRDIYQAEDILPLLKPIQMIDKFELTPLGLMIHSSGDDPAFEFQLKQRSTFVLNILQGVFSILLSLCIFLLWGKMSKSMGRIYFITPILLSIGVAVLFYPGSMSYDTFYALSSARSGVTESLWPPMVSYVWRVVDLVSHNPSSMHFFQVLLLLSSVYYILVVSVKNITSIKIFFIIYLMIPSILGTLAVIWKDVLMSAFLLSGFALIEALKLVINKWAFKFISLALLFFVFVGICVRHNAITAAVPFLFYFSFVFCSRTIKNPNHSLWGVFLLGSILTGMLYFAKIQLDTYSLPTFARLNNGTGAQLQTVKVLDVAGASLCVGANLFGPEAQSISLEQIARIYDPRHANLSLGLLSRKEVFVNIEKIWRNTALRHPICFLNNKFQLTKYMIGANSGQQFLITHPSIDSNIYGYTLEKSPIRDSIFSYIIRSSRLFFLKPWFLYLISIGIFLYMAKKRSLSLSSCTLFLSAFFYIGGFILYGNAADARLLFYTTTVLAMFVFISIANRNKPAG